MSHELSSNNCAKRPQGTLFVLATPIGNMEDITLRALRILGTVDLVASEDTRNTGKLLAHHGIKARLVSFHEHNEKERTRELIRQLHNGTRVALVSDAGTPLVSDPGYRLVSAAAADGLRIVPVPGPSSLTAALSVSGLPTDAFVFIGFLPRKKEKRTGQLARLGEEDKTLVFFESPRRVMSLLAEAEQFFGNRQAVLCREMTKRHEECLRGSLSQIRAALEDRARVKGECTLLVTGKAQVEEISDEELEAEIRNRLARHEKGISVMARELSRELGVSRNKIYKKAVRIRQEGKWELTPKTD